MKTGIVFGMVPLLAISLSLPATALQNIPVPPESQTISYQALPAILFGNTSSALTFSSTLPYVGDVEFYYMGARSLTVLTSSVATMSFHIRRKVWENRVVRLYGGSGVGMLTSSAQPSSLSLDVAATAEIAIDENFSIAFSNNTAFYQDGLTTTLGGLTLFPVPLGNLKMMLGLRADISFLSDTSLQGSVPFANVNGILGIQSRWR